MPEPIEELDLIHREMMTNVALQRAMLACVSATFAASNVPELERIARDRQLIIAQVDKHIRGDSTRLILRRDQFALPYDELIALIRAAAEGDSHEAQSPG